VIRWALFVAGGLALVVVVVAVIGSRLPKAHTASRTVRVPLPPAAVHALILKRIAEPQDYPLRVERDEPLVVVTRIAGEKLPFGGTWTYRIAPAGGASELTITEDGEVYNPIFRFMSRFVFGYYATMDGFIKNLQDAAASKR
jgi:hypothetical protein